MKNLKMSLIFCVATYENNNHLLRKKKKKFQLVEKIIVKTPKFLKNKSFVIMDGNFMCIDPYESNKYSIIGNVKNNSFQNIVIFQNLQKNIKN